MSPVLFLVLFVAGCAASYTVGYRRGFRANSWFGSDWTPIQNDLLKNMATAWAGPDNAEAVEAIVDGDT